MTDGTNPYESPSSPALPGGDQSVVRDAGVVTTAKSNVATSGKLAYRTMFGLLLIWAAMFLFGMLVVVARFDRMFLEFEFELPAMTKVATLLARHMGAHPAVSLAGVVLVLAIFPGLWAIRPRFAKIWFAVGTTLFWLWVFYCAIGLLVPLQNLFRDLS